MLKFVSQFMLCRPKPNEFDTAARECQPLLQMEQRAHRALQRRPQRILEVLETR